MPKKTKLLMALTVIFLICLLYVLATDKKPKETYQPAGLYYETNNILPEIVRHDLSEVDLYKPTDFKREFDENFIPLFRFKEEDYYHPVVIAQYGLKEYNEFVKTGNLIHLKAAKNAADWLVNNQNKGDGIWYYHFDFNVGGMNLLLPAPWGSAMAQGQAVSLLSRVALFVQNPEPYIESARKGIPSLTVPVVEGGFLAYFDDHPFFEEYPTIPHNYTLNGYIFALIGLYDLYTLHGDEDIKKLYEEGLETLKYMLPFYNSDNISAYHLSYITMPPRKVHSAWRYHLVHIQQLEVINSISPSKTFEKYIKLWKSYKEDK